MLFSLDVRRARKGDCLILHYGDTDDPRLILIDGGPAGVYGPHLKPRLAEIRKARKLDAKRSLPVDALMISHVDDDHIRGILDLAKELQEAKRDGKPLPVKIRDLWHNSFDEIVDGPPEELTGAVKNQFGAAAVSGGELSDDEKLEVEERYAEINPEADPEDEREVVAGALQVLASIEQGHRLRSDARGLGIPINNKFGRKLIQAAEDGKPVKLNDDLKITVAGPMRSELLALQKKHDEWLKRLEAEGKSPPSALAAYVDKSVPNLSSIVMLAESDGKTMLLTGDARGDKILAGLELVGLLKTGGKMKVDLLKVPHHGSANNLDNDFFERIIADHYVFSGDGEHGNPERESLEMLFKARGNDDYAIHLTYPIDDIDVLRREDWAKEQNKERKKKEKNPSKKVRPDWSPGDHALRAFFDAHPGLEEKVRIVHETGPHVIDLLDPLGY